MDLISSRFPEQFGKEKVKPKMTSLTEAQFEVTKQLPTKVPPWSTGFQMARQKVQKILTPEESDRPGIRAGKYLPMPGALKFYKVQGVETATDAVPPNPSLTSFKTGNSIKPSFENPDEMAKSYEVAVTRQTRITNALDWQCATAASLVLELNKHTVSDRAKDKIKKVGRILMSAGKSIAQLEQEQTVTLANCRLRRRDAYLRSTGYLPDDVKSKMRTQAITDKRLFEETTVQAALTRSREDASAKSTLKTVQLMDKLSYSKKQEPRKTQYQDRYKKPQQKAYNQSYGQSSSHTNTSQTQGHSQPKKQTDRYSGKAPQRAGRGGGRR